jgi:CheY-like chemotaxis protein
MQAPIEFTREVGHALSHLYDPEVLRKHTLINLFGLNKQPNAQSLLREMLIRAIEGLKPAADTPIESRTWRVYKVLQLRYIQQMDQEQTAYQVGVGVRHLRREQSAAIHGLADVLYEKVVASQLNDLPSTSAVPAAIEDELAWLQQNVQDETADVNEMVQLSLRRVAPLADARGIVLEQRLSEQLPPAVILPAALRQAIISLSTYAINRLSTGNVLFSTALHQQQIRLAVSAEAAAPLLPDSAQTLESLRAIRLILGHLSANLKISEDQYTWSCSLLLPAQGLISILMIDDNKDVADLFKRYTFGTEYTIEYLSDPGLVFEYVEKTRPHLMLLDIMIPKVDGWELLGRLRQHPKTSAIPIIVCSVLPERELAFALGASGYLSKPATRSALLEVLNRTSAGDFQAHH